MGAEGLPPNRTDYMRIASIGMEFAIIGIKHSFRDTRDQSVYARVAPAKRLRQKKLQKGVFF